MALQQLLPNLVITCFICLVPLAMSFTVIMSDSGTPSNLVDAPQNGVATGLNGARTDPREQQAVYEVMKATGNEWASGIPDVCRGRWHGIECMPDKDNVYHVVSLSFGALSDDTAFPTCDPIKSYISPSITELPHLRTLFFYRCFTSNPQPIPSFLGQLGPTLQTLVLRENAHVGPIPTQLGNLTRLRVLDLHKNNLNGSIPVSLGRLTNLRSLDLSGNRLTGSIPSFTFPALNILDLNQNHLSGPIPSSLGSFKLLIKMDLSRNRLSGPIPTSINNLHDLMLLDLSYNYHSGPFPISFANLGSLQALILKGNPMDYSTIPRDGFSGMKDLEILVLSNMNLHGPIPDTLGQLPNLRVLHLDRNHLNGSVPTTFKNLKNLAELRMNDNQLSGPVPFEREMVWRMKRKLRLYNNSGLCYNANSGFEDGAGSSYDSGISLCDTSKSGSERKLQHLSANEENVSRAINLSSAQVVKNYSFPTRLLQLVVLFLFSSHLI